ncbi:MAG: response regulator transcription factor [Anaerolineae bacterium]
MTPEAPIRVLIVDDHAIVRTGLRFFLLAMPDISLVGEASNGTEAVDLCGTLAPDVVLMDLLMPDLDGIGAIKLLRDRYPTVRVLALSSFQEGSRIREALQAGAIGYLLKDVTADELAAAIRAACRGRRTLSPELSGALVEATQSDSPDYGLTERQLEVLGLLVEGKSNAEIARELTITLATARFHVSTILSKMAAANRAEAAALAVKYGLVG